MYSFYSSRYTLSSSLGQHTRCIAPTNAAITYKFPMTTSLNTFVTSTVPDGVVYTSSSLTMPKADKHETKPGEISHEIEAPCRRSPVKTLDRASNDDSDQVKKDKQEAKKSCSAQPPVSRGELGRLA